MAPKLDEYVWRARRSPVMLTGLPTAFAIFAWFPRLDWAILAAPLTFFGFFVLLSQIGRDLGKSKEAQLYAIWGGKPTTLMLRHRDTQLDPTALSLLHAALSKLTGIPAPPKRKEAGNPDTADKIYDEYVRYLRDSTRDKLKFPRVFDELTNYGFRRNLWGLKPIGVALAGAGSLVALGAIWWYRGGNHLPVASVAAAIDVALLATWLWWITPGWVRIPAQAYAERLIEVALREGRPVKPKVDPPKPAKPRRRPRESPAPIEQSETG